MSARETLARVATSVLGSVPVAAVSKRIWGADLRVLAYHRVPDRAAFERQVELITDQYVVVTEAQVRAASAGGDPLPTRAVWITFDDGDPTVITAGLPVLARHGASATIYVCPGLIETGSAPWWEIVEAAGRAGHGAELGGASLQGIDLVRALKRVPDAERRAVVEALRPRAGAVGEGEHALTTRQLDDWVDAGGTVGNHTWDHPCLDRCTPDEQTAQVSRAHDWLAGYRPDHRPTFAYPNGDHTDHAEAVLVDLGYDTALLFDHQLAKAGASPLRTSRLRLDAEAPLGRARAVLSGAHSTLMGVRG